MRCDYCKFSNPPGVAVCQVCGARLPGVTCARCYFENPPAHTYCGQCGQSLTSPGETGEAQTPPGRVFEHRPTSLVALVGFGAILAVASVAYPWYLLGDQARVQGTPASMFYQLSTGWEWFPGLPLILIIVSSTLSTFLSILATHGRPHPVSGVLLGIVSLLSVIWLWQGIVAQRSEAWDQELTPMLATIGAIIVLVGAALTARGLLSRRL